ncbi:MAG: pro-sigmaK processing inhibitor BofA [Tissierellia bacterium]|nr:pro-sigmaK processing inhibitor BofA [Tissierellia bacterium]
MDITTLLAFLFGLFLLYIIGILLVIPIKLIIKLIVNGVIGGFLLLIANFIGGFMGLSININPITALVAGFLGVPGIVLLFIIQKIL